MSKKKNVFFVWGFGGSPDSPVVTSLRKLLGKDYKVISDYYAQYDPNEAKNDLKQFVKEYKIDIIIGSSLGGFNVMILDVDIPKIIINPCVHPEIELPLLKDENGNECVPEHMVKFYSEYMSKQNIWEHISDDDIFVLGENDEVFGLKYLDEIKNHCKNVNITKQGHHNTNESINEYLIPIIKTL